MESAYALANAEIEKIRNTNKKTLNDRIDEVKLKAPEYINIENTLNTCGLELSRSVLGSGKSFNEIKDIIINAQGKRAELLKSLSLPEDYLDEIYKCEKCRDTGFDLNGHRCECLKQLVSKYICQNSNLTELMRMDTFDKFDFSLFVDQPDIKGHSVTEIMKNVEGKAELFAETFEKTNANLFLFGDAGTGKTFVSSCIANRVLERGFSVYYQSAFELLDMLERIKFGRYSDSEQAELEYTEKYIYDVDLLIIDDLGTEFSNSFSTAALFNVINSRLINKKSVIISSNLNLTKISEVYGVRVASRLVGSYETLPFFGKDTRRMK